MSSSIYAYVQRRCTYLVSCPSINFKCPDRIMTLHLKKLSKVISQCQLFFTLICPLSQLFGLYRTLSTRLSIPSAIATYRLALSAATYIKHKIYDKLIFNVKSIKAKWSYWYIVKGHSVITHNWKGMLNQEIILSCSHWLKIWHSLFL